eukprot:PITA_08689
MGKVNKFVVSYLDDITVFSKSDQKHLKHLKKVLDRCRKFGISLNPKKSLFFVKEGKLLGHIISKEGVVIDPKRVYVIESLTLPINKKEIQAFLGKINFLRRFIPNYAEIVKDITNILRKDHEIKWNLSSRHEFEKIKRDISEAPTLASLDYTKPFSIFSFASETTLAAVLLQKNEDSHDQPIGFFSKVMKDVELKYDIIEKQAYALIQALKSFKMYVLHSPITAYVPNGAMKIVLTQPDIDGKRGSWITQILEFDLNIKTTNLVKGQGLANLLLESNCKVLGINYVLEIQGKNPQEPSVLVEGENPQEPLPSEQISPIHIDEKFLLSNWILWMTLCLESNNIQDYEERILLAYIVLTSRGKDILPTSSNQHRWVLTATDYFTKWVEAIPVRNVTDSVVIKFIEENILSRFGCPTQIVTENATTFSSVKLIDFCQKYQILLHHSTPYYLQGNDLVESSNKSMVKVIKKTLVDHKNSWGSHLIYAVWVNKITPKRSTGKSPFQLVYGKDAIFPTNLAFPVLKFLQDSTDEPDDFSRRINQIIELNENRDEVQLKLKKYQNKMKALFDRRARERDFNEGDLVLRWDARREEKGKHGKFDKLWFGPLAIAEVKGNNTFVLQNLEGLYSIYLVNGRFLKHYIQY